MIRVTVIEDNPELAEVFVELLQPFRAEVQTYTDALPGIEQLTASRPDLIIIGSELSPQREELTGAQVAHSVRSGTALRDVPIIMCTAALPTLDTSLSELMARGNIHRLEKPFDIPTFERVVQTALGRRHGVADAPGSGRILAEERDQFRRRSGDG